jgi:hypothetical protein
LGSILLLYFTSHPRFGGGGACYRGCRRSTRVSSHSHSAFRLRCFAFRDGTSVVPLLGPSLILPDGTGTL